jgi:hypothetical protein
MTAGYTERQSVERSCSRGAGQYGAVQYSASKVTAAAVPAATDWYGDDPAYNLLSDRGAINKLLGMGASGSSVRACRLSVLRGVMVVLGPSLWGYHLCLGLAWRYRCADVFIVQ